MKDPILLRLDSYPMLARIVFLVTLTGVLLLALLPVRFLPDLGMAVTFHDDKLNHAIAFVVLAALGSLGWPEHRAKLIFVLAFTGAAIEVLQGSQLIGRDLDGLDWVADCAGMALGLTIAGWTKRRVGRRVVGLS
ncbi:MULTISPECIES: hypothetical protein [unclassified Mesorhizobium]|uniref:hypothetical protein n=1 Tax=unclassified Mesorhizobium TaxID=325217 RepID=UPI001FE02DD0|nr:MULTISPECIES: hypothetical protein [unclassified Mesorhizobium]